MFTFDTQFDPKTYRIENSNNIKFLKKKSTFFVD